MMKTILKNGRYCRHSNKDKVERNVQPYIFGPVPTWEKSRRKGIRMNMDILKLSAVRYVSKLSNKLRRKLDMLSSRKEFSGSQGRTLHFLLAQTDDIFQKDIEEEYSIRPSTATELLKQMEKNGLITREVVPTDNRLKKIVVTEKAMVYQNQVVHDLTALEQELIKGIPEEKMKVFFEVVEKMMGNLSE